MDPALLLELVESLRDGGALLVVGDTELPGGADGAIVHLGPITGPDALDPSLRADTGVVVDASATLNNRNGRALLARLRDVHCRRVLLLTDASAWRADELRAIGFLPGPAPAGLDAALYRHEPGEFNPPREWNNAEHWAHPENFDRYRW